MLEKDITVLADKNKCNIQAVQKFSSKRSKRRWFKIRQLSRYPFIKDPLCPVQEPPCRRSKLLREARIRERG